MISLTKFKRLLVLSTLVIGAGAMAQDKPPIKILVGFVPGGTSDTVARMLAEELRPVLGRTVIVENKPGAGGRLAAEALKAAPADGSTYLFSPDSWAIFPTLLVPEATLRYNYLQDMAPVARVISYPLGLYGSKSTGAKNLKEYVALAKKKPELAMYASAGAGSITEFLGVVMSKQFGVKMTVVPYKGAGDVKTAIIGGQAPAGIMAPGDILQFTDDRVVPLGFMTKQRWHVAPHIPTMLEQGYNVTQGDAFMALWASSKTPVAERQVMEDAVRRILNRPDFKEKLVKKTVAADFASAADLDKQVRQLLAFWGPVIKESGFKP